METSTNLSMSTEAEICDGLLSNGLDILKYCVTDTETLGKYADRLNAEKLAYQTPKSAIDTSNWLIPDLYKNMDIEAFLIEQCPITNSERLTKELALFRKHDMIIVLKAMKYLVDTMRSENIVWGVGRGSCVASYALYLLGVHKIDPVKYNLPINEFFKGE